MILNADPNAFSTEDKLRIDEVLSFQTAVEDHESRTYAGLDSSASQDFNFGYDAVRYWFDQLARVFRIESEEFFRSIENLILNDWKLPTSLNELDCTRQMYEHRPFEDFSNSHGSAPRIERFATHVEMQAMLCLAVSLLAQNRVHFEKYSDCDENLWESWIARWDISIPSLWASDLRLETPLATTFWQVPKTQDWRAAPTEREFEETLGLIENFHPECIQVWGSSTIYQSQCSRTHSVRSALVSPETATVLMSVLQNSNPHDFRLPHETDREMEIFEELGNISLVLKGWISKQDIVVSNLEETDPFRYRGALPSLAPGLLAKEQFDLNLNESTGEFISVPSVNLVALREFWCDKPAILREENHTFITNGERLWFNQKSLLEFLSAQEQHLIVEVGISRSIKDGELDQPRNSYGEGRHDQWSRIYIFDECGGVASCIGNHRIGQKDPS